MAQPSTQVEFAPDWREGRWVSVPQVIARDPELSWKAKGIVLLLASHAETFRFSAEQISQWAADGKTATYSGLRELEAAGYLTRLRLSGGQMVYQLHPQRSQPVENQSVENREEPGQDAEVAPLLAGNPDVTQPPPGNQPVENQPVENPHVGFQEVYKNSIPKEYHSEEDQTTAPQGAAVADAPQPAADGGLFAAPETERAAPERSPAQLVVAAYVDAFRARSGGSDPLRQDIGKVAGAAARLVQDAGVDLERLQIAAGRLAGTGFTDLAGEYRRMMTGGDRRTGTGAIVPDVNDPRSVIYSGKDYWTRTAEADRVAEAERQAAIARGEIEPDPIYF